MAPSFSNPLRKSPEGFARRQQNGDARPESSSNAKKPTGPNPQNANARLEKLARSVFIGTIVTIVAVGFGVVSIASSQATVSQVTGNMKPALVAKTDILAGNVITADAVTTVNIPSTYLSTGSIADIEEVVGQTATLNIPANSQITSDILTSTDNTSRLSAKLSPGRQAITVSVNAYSGLSSLLRCGDLVHVYAVSDNSQPILLASSVTVLALDGNLSGPTTAEASYSTVTMDVSPQEAATIMEAEQSEQIVLALNPLSDATRG